MLAYEPIVPPTTSPIESAVVHSIAHQAPQPVVANRGRAFASATLIVALVLGLLAGRAIVNRLAAPAQVTRAAAVQSAAPSQTPTPATSPRAATVVPQAAVADGADEAVPARLPAADAANVGERARPPASEVANTGERRRPPVRARSIAPSAPATARGFAGRPSAPPRATIEKSPPVAPRVGQPVAASVAAATTPASRAAAPTASAVALATPVAAANSAPAAVAPAVSIPTAAVSTASPPTPSSPTASAPPVTAAATAATTPTAATVTPAAAASPTAAVLAPDTRAVLGTLYRYQEAFSTLDSNAAQQVWPDADVRALDRAFNQLAQQTFDLRSCDVGVAGARAEAVCTGTASYARKVGNKTMRVEARRWRFALRRDGSEWLIDRVEVR